MNTCPLASTCNAYALYQRDELIRLIHECVNDLGMTLWIIEASRAGGPAPFGMDLPWTYARALHRMEQDLPATTSGLCRAIARVRNAESGCR